MNTRRWLMLALGVAAVLLILGRALAGVYSDYLWYDALGAGALWRLRMSAVLTLRVGSAIAAALFAFCNLYAVRQSVVQLVFPRRVGNLEISEEVSGRYLMGAAIVLSAVLGVLLAIPHGDWMALVLARTGRLFGTLDPYIGADLGFFVYWLPLENTLWTWAVLCVIVISLAVILLYALTPSLKWQRGSIYASMYVRRHFTILSGVMLLMLAWSFRLDMYALLTQGSGADGTFSWVDHQYGITGNLLLSILTLGAGLIVMWAGSVGQFRLAAISVLSVVVMSLVAREVVPAVAQRLGTDAERTARERPYIAARVSYTRRAFRRSRRHCPGFQRGIFLPWRARSTPRAPRAIEMFAPSGACRATVCSPTFSHRLPPERLSARRGRSHTSWRAARTNGADRCTPARRASRVSTTRRLRRHWSIPAHHRSRLSPTRQTRSTTPWARHSSRSGAESRARGRCRTSRFSHDRCRSRGQRSSRAATFAIACRP